LAFASEARGKAAIAPHFLDRCHGFCRSRNKRQLFMTTSSLNIPPAIADASRPGFFSRTAGKVVGVFMALLVRSIAGFFGEFASYYSAKAYYDKLLQGDYDPSAHLRAAAFALHDGARTGMVIGLIAYIVLFLLTSAKCGWRSIPFAVGGSVIAAIAAGYIAGLSP
jgi:hypothetical protein